MVESCNVYVSVHQQLIGHSAMVQEKNISNVPGFADGVMSIFSIWVIPLRE